MSGKHEAARLERLFGTKLARGTDHLARLRQGMTPEMRAAIRSLIQQHEGQMAALKDALEDQEELKSRLRLTQHVLIVALQKMGGSIALYAGQLNEIPAGSVVKVDKLEKGEGDAVPLLVSWRPPNPEKPATTDLRPGS